MVFIRVGNCSISSHLALDLNFILLVWENKKRGSEGRDTC